MKMKLFFLFLTAFALGLTGCKAPRPRHHGESRTVIVERPMPAPVHRHAVVRRPPPPPAKHVKKAPPGKSVKRVQAKPVKRDPAAKKPPVKSTSVSKKKK